MVAKHRSSAGREAEKTRGRLANSSQESDAMELALSYLTEHDIKPRLTLKEFAAMYQMDFRQVQSDAERGYLPLVPRAIPGRRELKQVNMVAYYARMYLDGFNHLEKAATFGS